ncbi:NAD(P)-binding domain-containing protein [Campylobacter sputorum]|uniref:NAD(P)-binding domain-containing protein n=1 Tax=Campylobacter sputorum TaxID=206 RepID=UPI0018966C32|nr:NAD(P)-binding domain-containing protein [Campylobacter sp. RM11259]MBF6678082.1 NAD(P)-binding domain-containing protein [Campylobacter sp. RM11259]
MKNIYDVVVIGGGPCGIASVVESKKMGFENVLLLEKGDNHSQTIRKFYKDNKRVDKEYKNMPSVVVGNVPFETSIKEDVLDYFDKLLEEEKVDTVFNIEVEKVQKIEDIFHVATPSTIYEAKNVVVAIGKMGRPNKPDYKIPTSLNSVVNFNLNSCSNDEKIMVVGGGNSAAEYAIELSKANIVTLCYRKITFTRLNDINERELLDLAEQNKLNLKLGIDIIELENENNKIKVKFSDGSYEIYDRIIYAIGGSTPIDFLQRCSIKVNENSQPIVDENLMTNIPGLYVGGDIVTKNGGSIVFALNHAHNIISHIKSKI